MSVDHLQISIMEPTYQSIAKWLPEIQPGGQNDVIEALHDLNTVLESVTGLTKDGALVQANSTENSIHSNWSAQNPVYGNERYISHTNAVNLYTDLMAQFVGQLPTTTFTDIAVRSYRNDLTASDSYIYGTGDPHEGLEIYISNCLYRTTGYVEPTYIDEILSRVNDAIDSISGLEFAGIVVSSTHLTGSDGIYIGVDDATYNGQKYLTIANASALRSAVLNVMSSVTDLDDTNIEVEIRIGKKDTTPST